MNLSQPASRSLSRSASKALGRAAARIYNLTSALPPGVTLTRATTATRFTSSGSLSTEAIDTPRFDYDPLTLAPLGLLVEIARTNRFKYGSDFTNAVWNKGASPFAVAGNAQVAPDGTTTADTLTFTSFNSTGYDLYQNTTGYTVGATMVAEGWVKLGTATNFALVMNNAAAWNTVGGKTFTTADGLSTSTWKKISYTFTVPATGNLNMHLGYHGQTGQTQQTAGTVHLWGFRVTAAAGSEIPTTSSIVTQAADILSIPLANGIWDITVSDTEGTETVRRSVYGGAWTAIARTGSSHITTIKCVQVRALPAGLDSYTMGWLGANDIIDSSLQSKYLNFMSLVDSLCPTISAKLMLIPCRSGEGYLKPFGKGISTHPSQLQGNFREVGTVTRSTTGASITYAANWANRIETPSGYVHNTHKAEPNFMGIVYTNESPATAYFTSSVDFIHWNIGTTTNYLGTFAGADSVTPAFHVGVNAQNITGAQFTHSHEYANDSFHISQFYGVDMKDARKNIVAVSNDYVTNVTHATASPSTSATTGLYFYPGIKTTGTTTGKLQYLVFISGGIVDIMGEMRLFWKILSGTLLSDMVTGKAHYHIGQHGQSLSSNFLSLKVTRAFNLDSYRITRAASAYGGTAIAAWVGSDPNSPVRASQYTGGIYAGDGSASIEATWPFGITATQNWFMWLQGENDSNDRALVNVYAQQLENLRTFVKADLGTTTRFAINLLDYSIGSRTSTTYGNFTVSGISGSGSDINGTWTITAITRILDGTDPGLVTNAHAAYSWTKSGGGTLSKNGSGLWEIAISGTVYATADQIVTHPELVTSWTLASGTTGTPAFSESKTGNIERMRAIQLAHAAAHPTDTVAFDSRGCTRGEEDTVDGLGDNSNVHPNMNGYTLLASRAKAAILSLP